MANFSDYTEANIINATLRGVAFPLPAATYISLHTANPTDANTTSTEVQVGAFPAYARQDAAAGGAISSGWTAPSASGSSSNAKAVTFPANNGAGAVVITHIGIYDAASGGNLLYHGALTVAKTLQVSDVLAFSVGSLVVTTA